jgi:hypothetical protein
MPGMLEWLAETCRTSGAAVATRFFRAYEPRAWLSEAPT